MRVHSPRGRKPHSRDSKHSASYCSSRANATPLLAVDSDSGGSSPTSVQVSVLTHVPDASGKAVSAAEMEYPSGGGRSA